MARERSGQITVTTAGTAVQGPTSPRAGGTGSGKLLGFYLRALSGNAGAIYVGNDGADDVTSSDGFELSAGEGVFVECNSLDALWFDAANDGDKVSWLLASGA